MQMECQFVAITKFDSIIFSKNYYQKQRSVFDENVLFSKSVFFQIYVTLQHEINMFMLKTQGEMNIINEFQNILPKMF